jgi:hypothetical protein
LQIDVLGVHRYLLVIVRAKAFELGASARLEIAVVILGLAVGLAFSPFVGCVGDYASTAIGEVGISESGSPRDVFDRCLVGFGCSQVQSVGTAGASWFAIG